MHRIVIFAFTLGIAPVLSMETAGFNIDQITPIKQTMTREEAERATHKFLCEEILTADKFITPLDIKEQKTSSATGATRLFPMVVLHDGSEWALACDGLQRLIGMVYLEKAIAAHNLKSWQVVETKFYMPNPNNPFTVTIKRASKEPLANLFTIDSPDFYTLSRYVGDEKPKYTFNQSEQNHIFTKLTGYIDLQHNTNLRVQQTNNKTIVIDTEYRSFTNDNKAPPPSAEAEVALGGIDFTHTITDFNGLAERL